MKPPALTLAEARAILTGLSGWAPMQCYPEFMAASHKLTEYATGPCCRDCSELGTIMSRLGGKVCQAHKAVEDQRYQNAQVPR